MPLKQPRKRSVGRAAPRKTISRSTTAEFERLLKKAGADEHYVLRLYIAGTTARSVQAIANVRAMCAEHLAGRYDLEVIDIYQQPQATERSQIIAAPTLVKELPFPPKRMIGDLSNRARVLVGLNLASGAGPGEDTKWLKL
jgi:circadian clock protein KaiB